MPECGITSRLRVASLVMLLATLVLQLGEVGAQVRSSASPRVTLHARKITFLAALRHICDQAHVTYTFQPDAATVLNSYQEANHISVDITNMPVEHAIFCLLRQSDLIDQVKFDAGKVVSARKAYLFSRGKALDARRVTIRVVNVPLVVALQRLCDQFGVNYVFDLGRFEQNKVTLYLKDVPIREGVDAILTGAQASPALEFTSNYGMVIVGHHFAEGNSEITRRSPLADSIHLKCQQENLYVAAWAIACAAGQPFTLTEHYKLKNVSLYSASMPLAKALQSLGVRGKLPSVVKYEDGILLIYPQSLKGIFFTNCPPAGDPVRK